VSADSKQYLYLDRAASWPGRRPVGSTIGPATVPHQHLGYLFRWAPGSGPLDRLGVPDWVAQRLWLGTLSAAALLGARWLFAQLGTGRAGAVAGALVYGLTPYQLAFTARISVLLLPWAALPWLVGLTMRATRTRDWRPPALLASCWSRPGGSTRRPAAGRGGPLPVGPCWSSAGTAASTRSEPSGDRGPGGRRVAVVLLGPAAPGAYGLPVLQLTENVRTVAEASTPGTCSARARQLVLLRP